MSDVYDLLANVVHVIREDIRLREAFTKILGAGLGSQRVPMLKSELELMNAPAIVLDFVRLLTDDGIAEIVLREINR
jgi:hypothetical protein